MQKLLRERATERWFSRNNEAATQKWKRGRQNWPRVLPGRTFAIDAACCFAAYSACLASIIFRMYSGISLEAANCDPETAPLPDILPTGPFSARATECDQSLLKLKLPKTLLDQEGRVYGMLPHLWAPSNPFSTVGKKIKPGEKKKLYSSSEPSSPYATCSHMHTAPSPHPRSSRSHALRYFGVLSVWPGLQFPSARPLGLGLLNVYPWNPVCPSRFRSSCFNV